MKRILLTGANGFIGRNVKALLGQQFELIEVSRNSHYDILHLDSLLQINNIDTVIHCAAKTFVPDSFADPYSFYNFNIKCTLNIAEYCRIKSVSKVIYLNSYPYGNPEYLPINETHPIHFHSHYNKSKQLCEDLLFYYLENVTNVVSLRLFNIFGQYQSDNFLIPTVLNQILHSNSVKVKDLQPKRDYLYIKDLIFLLEKVLIDTQSHGIFNVGSGKSVSVGEIIELIAKIVNKKIEVVSENYTRENEVMDCIADIQKVKDTFNWAPQFSLENGLMDYIIGANHV